MKVRILVSIASSEWGAPAPGEVVDISTDEAESLVAAGYAEKVTTKAPAKKAAAPKP